MKFGTIVAGVCGAVLLTGTLLMGSSYFVGRAFEAAQDESSTLMQSMRKQMFADMMHDAMRGVVYRSLYAANIGDADIAEQAQGEIVEYGDAFVDAIDSQKALSLPTDIRTALDDIAVPLTSYIESARSIVSQANSADTATLAAALPAFETAFGALEDGMEAVSDTIEAGNVRNTSASEAVATLSNLVNAGGLAVILTLVGAMAPASAARLSTAAASPGPSTPSASRA